MSNIIKCAFVCAMSALLSACAYTSIQMPMDTNFDQTQLGSKEGRSHTTTILYLVSWGNGGTKAAAENGGITVIHHADRQVFSTMFGFYTRITTVVYGD